ncbi:MAG: glycosyltransferase [Acidimicrobiia bacterium]|nr:glycosyltransferase [Acidimicrobiia bacterium]
MSSAASLRCSVVVLSDGSGGGLEATRASLAAQTAAPWEVHESPATTDVATSLSGAFQRATGEFVAVVDAGDTLHPETLARMAERVGPDVDVIYTDEDRLGRAGGLFEPFFKPDWSPDRLRVQPYVGRFCAMRRSVVTGVGGPRADAGVAHEWDLVLRVTERARRIEHAPGALYHRSEARSVIAREHLASDDARRVVNEHLDRTGCPATAAFDEDLGVLRLRPALDDHPKVSIVIPTAGTERGVWGRGICLVINCVQSIVERSTYDNYEIVCVVDESVQIGVRKALVEVGQGRARIVPFGQPFNFATKINLGAIEAAGDYLLLLNDDIEVISPDWIESMLLHAQDPDVGAVGATLRFADRRLQHVGVLVVGGNPGHPYYGFPAETRGYFDNLLVPTNCLAITAACLMSRRDAFEKVGGMSTQFPINYNDVDYGLKLDRAGYSLVHTPEAQMFHFESSSREPGEVSDVELEQLHARWSMRLARDPYYNPNFLPTADYLTLVLPAGETAADLDL